MAYAQAVTRADGTVVYYGYARYQGSRRLVAKGADKESVRRKADKIEKSLKSGDLPPGPGDPRLGLENLTLAEYVPVWLGFATLAPGTKKHYSNILTRTVFPHLGGKKMRSISKPDVRKALDACYAAHGPNVAQAAKAALSSAFRPLVDDDRHPDGRAPLSVNPVRGVSVKAAPTKPHPVVHPKVLKRVMAELPNDESRLFVEVLFVTGLRFGEITELRVSDIDAEGTVHVQRRVCDVGKDWSGNGGRFLVEKMTKTGDHRVVPLGKATHQKILDHVSSHRMGPDDLIFPGSLIAPANPRPYIEDIDLSPATEEEWGRTEPNQKGYTYPHGTLSAYSAGGCRCDLCRAAYRQYRRKSRTPRRSLGPNLTGHLAKDRWHRVWYPALKRAGAEGIRTHGLRHAFITWLIKGGTDIHTVMVLAGHKQLTTTQVYADRVAATEKAAANLMEGLLA